MFVIHHRVEQMHFVKNETALVLVHVYKITLEIHIQDADQNVFPILIAIAIRLARTTDARTLVQELAVLMPNVGPLITLQHALVFLDIPEIRWLGVKLKVSLNNQYKCIILKCSIVMYNFLFSNIKQIGTFNPVQTITLWA